MDKGAVPLADQHAGLPCHGGVNRILLSHFLGILPKLDRSPGGNTNISVVHTDGKKHTVERLFATDHVSNAGRP